MGRREIVDKKANKKHTKKPKKQTYSKTNTRQCNNERTAGKKRDKVGYSTLHSKTCRMLPTHATKLTPVGLVSTNSLYSAVMTCYCLDHEVEQMLYWVLTAVNHQHAVAACRQIVTVLHCRVRSRSHSPYSSALYNIMAERI